MPRYKPEERTLTAGGLTVVYTWERKAVKNYNMRVRHDGSVYVSTPARVTAAQVERFITDKIDFLRRALARVAERTAPEPLSLSDGEQVPVWGVLHTVTVLKSQKTRVWCEDGCLFLALPRPEDAAARLRAFRRFAAGEVEPFLRGLTAECAPLFLPRGAVLPEVTFRRMKSRWGSCFYTKNRICYNSNLIFAPRDCARYVVCHELAHFLHHDHSKAFYNCLARVLPDHKARRKVLHAFAVPQFAAEIAL